MTSPATSHMTLFAGRRGDHDVSVVAANTMRSRALGKHSLLLGNSSANSVSRLSFNILIRRAVFRRVDLHPWKHSIGRRIRPHNAKEVAKSTTQKPIQFLCLAVWSLLNIAFKYCLRVDQLSRGVQPGQGRVC